MSYKRDAILDLVDSIQGFDPTFRVYLSKGGRGDYGFYADADGRYVVSFQYDLEGYTYHSNYDATDRADGTGYRLDASHSNFRELFTQAFVRPLRGSVRPHTLTRHLEVYGECCEYVEVPQNLRKRLEYLRSELQAERLSYGELAELQALAPYIRADDTELLEAAGIPEKT